MYEPKPPPCIRPGCRLPSKPKQRAKREEDLREKRGKGDWDKPKRLAAVVLPSTPWELGVQGKYS